jgi:hypothetical protein
MNLTNTAVAVWICLFKDAVNIETIHIASINGLMNMVYLVEWELAEETVVLEEYMPSCHFVHHKSCVTYSGIELGKQRFEDGD